MREEPLPDVLYEDNHQLIVNKPAGILTQPSGTEQDSIEDISKEWLKSKYLKPGNVFLEAVHRIDKPVSGIVVFAKTSKALSRLNEAMRDKLTKKYYLAMVENMPPASEGALEHYLSHGEHRAIISHPRDPQAKLSILHYRLLKCEDNVSMIEICLETGRYHQIRAQFSAIGCPILGDLRYGSRYSIPFPGICLHHHLLQIPHPTTGDVQTFQADVPLAWNRLNS